MITLILILALQAPRPLAQHNFTLNDSIRRPLLMHAPGEFSGKRLDPPKGQQRGRHKGQKGHHKGQKPKTKPKTQYYRQCGPNGCHLVPMWSQKTSF